MMMMSEPTYQPGASPAKEGIIMFVEFTCGCVGIDPKYATDERGYALLVKVCDYDVDDATKGYCLDWRDMHDSLPHRSLTPAEVGSIVNTLGLLVWQGGKFREIKRLLD